MRKIFAWKCIPLKFFKNNFSDISNILNIGNIKPTTNTKIPHLSNSNRKTFFELLGINKVILSFKLVFMRMSLF